MYMITTTTHFDGAHFLAGYDGKCRNIHGHRWGIKVTAAAETLSGDGSDRAMVTDFSDLKKVLEGITDAFDHALIYEAGSLKETTRAALREEGFRMCEISFRPTAECLAKHIYDRMKDAGCPVYSVEVHETPGNAAIYTE